ncbi:MAG: NADH-quinone oxidoreductase subunit M [Bacteroidia bacterium]|nr:NADH-quinone oxidoreductase subunit M [Bacteroidia bacterium]
MISILILIPFVAAIVVLFSGEKAKTISFYAAIAELIVSFYALTLFRADGGMQFVQDYWWIPSLGISYTVGADGISMLLVLLTTVLTPLIIYSSFSHNYSRPGLFYSLILIMQAALIGVFTALDGFLFYVFWELALIPIYLICLVWGGKDRVRITLKFFIYTLFGSLLMLVALIWLWLQTPGTHSFALEALYKIQLTPGQSGWIFWAFFISFAIKMPVFPFHTWQPDTYTDSPTPGTMLLSGIMLKMGVYGLIRWLLPIATEGIGQWGWLALSLSLVSVLYASIIALVQKDFKRLIAFSSIAHVGLISAGVFSLSLQGTQGAVIQMLNHGINVVGLFFIADILSTRLKTREMSEMGGIRLVAPRFSAVFIILVMASIALPLTNGFVGEFLLINGIFQVSGRMAAVAGLTIILGAVYMLTSYRKIVLGDKQARTALFADLTPQEKGVLVPLVVLIIAIGVYPSPILRFAEPSVKAILGIIHGHGGMALMN